MRYLWTFKQDDFYNHSTTFADDNQWPFVIISGLRAGVVRRFRGLANCGFDGA
jgi:hypothetical protein